LIFTTKVPFVVRNLLTKKRKKNRKSKEENNTEKKYRRIRCGVEAQTKQDTPEKFTKIEQKKILLYLREQFTEKIQILLI